MALELQLTIAVLVATFDNGVTKSGIALDDDVLDDVLDDDVLDDDVLDDDALDDSVLNDLLDNSALDNSVQNDDVPNDDVVLDDIILDGVAHFSLCGISDVVSAKPADIIPGNLLPVVAKGAPNVKAGLYVCSALGVVCSSNENAETFFVPAAKLLPNVKTELEVVFTLDPNVKVF